MLDGFFKFLLAQIEQFLPTIEIRRLARFSEIGARLALVLIGWTVCHWRSDSTVFRGLGAATYVARVRIRVHRRAADHVRLTFLRTKSSTTSP
jgi:hypothetical protein